MKKILAILSILITTHCFSQNVVVTGNVSLRLYASTFSPITQNGNAGDLWLQSNGGVGNLWGNRNGNWYQFFQTVDTNTVLATKSDIQGIGTGTVTSIGTSTGITGGTITTTGTLKADTSLLATQSYVNTHHGTGDTIWTTVNAAIFPNSINDHLGIGTQTPTAPLTVVSSTSPAVKIVDGTQGANKVLTSDASGNASWGSTSSLVGPTGATGATGIQGASGATGATGTGVAGATGPTGAAGSLNAWGLTGNTGTTYGTNFLGTTDGQDFQIKVNNQPSGKIEYNTNTNQSTAFGYQALSSEKWASGDFANNTAFGYQALQNDTIIPGGGLGGDNLAIGYEAAQNMIGGQGNVAVGGFDLQNCKNGKFNTIVGFSSMQYTLGSENTVVGNNNHDLFSPTDSCSYNIVIGYNNTFPKNTHSSIIIGNNVATATNNQMILGGDSIKNAYFPLNGGAANTVLTNDGSGNASWATAPGAQVATNYLAAQAAALTTLRAYTIPATDGMYRIGAFVNITAVSVDVLQFQVTYTDETNTSQTEIFYPQGLTSASLAATGNYTFPTMDIRVKASTTITLKTVLTTGAGSITYDAGGSIEYLGY